jgi:hypothetical protein
MQDRGLHRLCPMSRHNLVDVLSVAGSATRGSGGGIWCSRVAADRRAEAVRGNGYVLRFADLRPISTKAREADFAVVETMPLELGKQLALIA